MRVTESEGERLREGGSGTTKRGKGVYERQGGERGREGGREVGRKGGREGGREEGRNMGKG